MLIKVVSLKKTIKDLQVINLGIVKSKGQPMQVVLPYFRARKVAVMTMRSEADLQALKAAADR